MSTRNIKDAKDLSTGELIYFKSHAQATFMSDGRTVEEAVSGISGGSSGGNGAYPEVDGTIFEDFTQGVYTCYDAEPNTFYVFPECTDLTFHPNPDVPRDGLAHEYLFQFTSGATATTLSLPSDLKWANDTPPTIKPNMIYQVSILKGLASVLEFSNAQGVFPATLVTGTNGEVGTNVYTELYGGAVLNDGDLALVVDGTSYSIVDYSISNTNIFLINIGSGIKAKSYYLRNDGVVFTELG